jgi:hypothetical protein
MSSKVTISIDADRALNNLFIKTLATYLVIVTIVDSRKKEETFYNNLLVRMIIFTVFFLSVFQLGLGISTITSIGVVIMTFLLFDA